MFTGAEGRKENTLPSLNYGYNIEWDISTVGIEKDGVVGWVNKKMDFEFRVYQDWHMLIQCCGHS